MPPRPHPLARAPIVDRLDRWIAGAWERGWMDHVSLDPHELVRKASKDFTVGDAAGGRDAEDIEDFSARLEALSASVREEAGLNAVGHAFAYGLLTRAIRQRYALGSLWRQKPELLQTKIAPPIIVVGQMRSGTTRVHRLLAVDPAHSATRFCDSWHPVPQKPDFRRLRGGFTLFMARTLDPWLDSLHPFGAARADEELGWLASCLDHSAYEAQWHIPSFSAFSERRNPAAVYREFARLLRTDAAQRGNGSKPRVMKTPQFTEDLSALLEEFPNARIIVSRRCGEDTLRSSVSLVANQMVIQSNNVDLEVIEREWRRKLALRSERMEAALSRFNGRIAEVHFDELGEDWLAEITRIYRELSMELTDVAVAAMQREMAASERSPHHGHSVQMAKFSEKAVKVAAE